jgi:hypothetical protein
MIRTEPTQETDGSSLMALGGLILQETLRQDLHQEHQRRGTNDFQSHSLISSSLYQTGEIIKLVTDLSRDAQFCYERMLDGQRTAQQSRIKSMNAVKTCMALLQNLIRETPTMYTYIEHAAAVAAEYWRSSTQGCPSLHLKDMETSMAVRLFWILHTHDDIQLPDLDNKNSYLTRDDRRRRLMEVLYQHVLQHGGLKERKSLVDIAENMKSEELNNTYTCLIQQESGRQSVGLLLKQISNIIRNTNIRRTFRKCVR